MYVQNFNYIQFLPYEGYVMLMEVHQIIPFSMKSLSEKVYQLFWTFQFYTINLLFPLYDQSDQHCNQEDTGKSENLST